MVMPYLISNVQPNLIMIALHDSHNTPLYKDFNISIHTQWLDMFTLSHQTHFINISCETNDVPCDSNNEDGFEDEQKYILTNTMVQNIFSFEQIYNYFEKCYNCCIRQRF